MDNETQSSSGHRGMKVTCGSSHGTAVKNSTQSQKSQSVTYSSALTQQQFSSKKQAIVINAIEDVPTSEYKLAVGKQIGPKNIKYASKVSNGRVCIYLSSVESVDNYMSSFESIKIANQVIPSRRLAPSLILVLFNVSPTSYFLWIS
ncbi:hypothetical protein WA026_016736 [Henosepilachna vigintioctopunctata]|uniref:Uncharacterized protein n=1 Tax=Henosepilachna vigintioctopunctata TaxID=420089 RepID=A0AAW1UZC3_9CUCU